MKQHGKLVTSPKSFDVS